MLSRSSITAVLLAVVVTTGVGGCGLVPGGEADPTPDSTDQQSEPQSPEPEPSGPESPESSQSSDDPAEDQNESGNEAVARATTATTSGAEMEISVRQAVVEGELLRIRVSYKLTEATEDTYSVYDFAGSTDPGVYLIDNVNLQRYSVVTSDGSDLESDVRTQGAGGPTLTYYFAAPPEDVDSLTLAFTAAPWPAIDVPIER